MRDEGWTLQDLGGELFERGLSLDDIMYDDLLQAINFETAEKAAQRLERLKGVMDVCRLRS